ncbi:molybdate-binding protein [Streptomyces pilosus]|uniref:molybdate ABC transporter substrate-binding protein n=1 Tax=Streptomyces pilosus TaxID=28893 RepID=UPI0016798F4B|nr:molybdate ABC transporter substrate-binding protein [Streptomyces pilosus]GGV51385.1 molybdate-binding protein [Streptomyces pilosus]
MTRRARRTRVSRRIAGFGAVAALALSGCSPSDSGSPGGAGGDAVTGTVTVFAASSLKESFTELAGRFEKEHPGAEVAFNFSGSDSLAAGINNGAPADVFAAASAKTMRLVTDEGRTAGGPRTFVRNRLQIATAPGNPHGIRTLKDLTAPGLKVVLCDRTVPCGAAAQTALAAGGAGLTPVSYEQDVKSALTKVQLKEADAALVYGTDVHAAGDKVEGVHFPESAEAVNDYPIARLEDAPNPSAAKAFVELVTSAEGRKVLVRAGFLEP